MRFSALEDWLAWQETLHPKEIDLGLGRVAAVAATLQLLPQRCPVITVAGTNGKGSCVAMLDAILRAAGYRTGTYTSPHLLRYNERIKINGDAVDDAALCDAFARIDAARGEISLSYFEFGTLAALDILLAAELDVVILEVGLGGRLDAANIVDADAALISSIDIDHVAWLGDDREAIGREKAGIFRSHRPAVCGDAQPPDSLQRYAREIGAQWFAVGDAFDYLREDDHWSWSAGEETWSGLPLPTLVGEHQVGNAAAVLAVLNCLSGRLPVSQDAAAAGLRVVSLPGRFQRIDGPVERILDVAHNAQGGRSLAQTLRSNPVRGQTYLVLGMLADKNVNAFLSSLLVVVDYVYLGGLSVPRGLSGPQLADALEGVLPVDRHRVFTTVCDAHEQALTDARPGDRVVVCGSFYSVAEVIGRQTAQ